MKPFLIAISVIFLIQCCQIECSAQIYLSDNLSGVLVDTVYYVEADIRVEAGDTLQVQPGAEFHFLGNFYFNIEGYFSAVGSEIDSIKFLPFAGVECWKGIVFDFENCPDRSGQLRYCCFSSASESAVLCLRADIIIENCTFSNNISERGAGIYLNRSNPCIASCVFFNNSSERGSGIYCKTNSNPVISNCDFIENIAECGGGICAIHSSDPLIEDCFFSENSTINKGGAVCCSEHSRAILKRCIFNQNHTRIGGGIVCYSQRGIEIQNCTFYANEADSAGGGIYIVHPDSLLLVSSIFTLNTNGAVHFANLNNAPARYNDFFENIPANFMGLVPAGLGEVNSTNANGDSCDCLNNIFLDPRLTDPSAADFCLGDNSPCIDAGNPNSPWDPDSTIADIGAYYFDQILDVDDRKVVLIPAEYYLDRPYPNPFNSSVRIEYGIPVAALAKLTLYDVTGRVVDEILSGWQTAGYYHQIYTSDGLASGIYFLRFEINHFTKTEKVIYLK